MEAAVPFQQKANFCRVTALEENLPFGILTSSESSSPSFPAKLLGV